MKGYPVSHLRRSSGHCQGHFQRYLEILNVGEVVKLVMIIDFIGLGRFSGLLLRKRVLRLVVWFTVVLLLWPPNNYLAQDEALHHDARMASWP